MSEPSPSSWWTGPDLDRCWEVIAARLEREGLSASGRTRVIGLTRAERRALTGLLGRTVLGDQVQIDVAALDARLRLRAGCGIVEAAERVLGRALTDRPANRSAQRARRELPQAAYRQWRAEHPGASWDALDGWYDGLRRDGVLARTNDPAGLVTTALDLIWERVAYLEGAGDLPDPVARTELAAQRFGDAHALDDGRRLGIVVLRAVESLVGSVGWVGSVGSVGSRREQWEQIGVLADRVSSTALTLGVRVRTGSVPGERLAAYERGWSVAHVTWRDLDHGLMVEPGQRILVCENPRVLEAAAEQGRSGNGGDPGYVCGAGRPALIVLALLDRLRAAGGNLRYHGDFDWAGIEIANLLVRRCAVQPWRMRVEDYLAVPAQLSLVGKRVEASWDPELAPAMAQRGVAVHEEAQLPTLVHDWRQ